MFSLLIMTALAQDAIVCGSGATVPATTTCAYTSLTDGLAAIPDGGVIHAYGSFTETLTVDRSFTLIGRDTTDGVGASWTAARVQGNATVAIGACTTPCALRVEDMVIDSNGGQGFYLPDLTSASFERVEFSSSRASGVAGSLGDFRGSFDCTDCDAHDLDSGGDPTLILSGPTASWTRGSFRAIAGGNGGVMSLGGVDMTITDTVFDNITLTTRGVFNSAIWVHSGSQLTMSGSTISASTVDDSFLEVWTGTATVSDTTLTGLLGEGWPVTLAHAAGTLTLRNVTIDGQSIPSTGSIKSTAGTLILEDVWLQNLRDGNRMTIEGGTLSWSGGGLRNSTGNCAINLWGGVTADLEFLTVEDNDFTTGASTSTSVFGGALCVLADQTTLASSIFRRNRMNNGVVVQSTSAGSLTISDSLFDSNVAVDVSAEDGFGGAIITLSPTGLTLTDSDFRGNQAKRGGAIWLAGAGKAVTQRNLFCANSATLSGGAIYVGNEGKDAFGGVGLLKSDHDVFVENDASEGGAVDAFHGSATLIHATAWGNAATAGSAVANDTGTVAVVNSIIAGHRSGAALHTGTGALTGDYIQFWDNTLGDLSGSATATNWWTGDPELTAMSMDGICGNDDWTPLFNSPVIDRGDAFYGLDSDNSNPDLGATGGPFANEPDVVANDGDGDGSPVGTDCDDTDPTSFPGATELCDGADNDCDNAIDEEAGPFWYADTDGDQHGDPSSAQQACAQPAQHVASSDDCDDLDASAYTGATETCDGVDDDCDALVDEGVLTTFYEDGDEDGQGTVTSTADACIAPTGFVASSTDCDDTDPLVYDGATEVCNGIDDDCDTFRDEGVLLTFYEDTDVDGHGDAGSTTEACTAPDGYVATYDDCNDGNADISPSDPEVCNGQDDDCNGTIDDGVRTLFYTDQDGDGHGSTDATLLACGPSDGWVTSMDDCDDGDNTAYPGATEVCDGDDEDCDTLVDEGLASTWYVDNDNDGFHGTEVQACTQPADSATSSTDCDDQLAAVNPSAYEVCDGIDNDCDGTIDTDDDSLTDGQTGFVDADNDGYGDGSPITFCGNAGYADNDTDCNDAEPAVHPDADELCDGEDQDCDDIVDEGATDFILVYVDADQDGFGAGEGTLGCPDGGHVASTDDCDDTNAAVHPLATEVPNDGTDNDCSGSELVSAVGGASCAHTRMPSAWGLLLLPLLGLRRRPARSAH